MKNTIVKFENEAKELKKAMFVLAVENDIDFTDVDDDAVKTIANMLKFCDTSIKLVVEQSKMINEIDEKLDKLMAKIGS